MVGLALAAGAAARPAGASVTGCATNTVTITLDEILTPSTTIKHGAGTTLLVDGAPCGNVSHLRTVHVNGTGHYLGTLIDLSSGQFFDGVGDMHFTVSFPDASDELDVNGGAWADHINLGSNGINLDVATNSTVDVGLSGTMTVRLSGNAGNDILSGAGGGGTGGITARPMIVEGGTGTDVLVGGNALDAINANDGADAMYGLAGNDILYGVPDGVNDTIAGGAGRDALWSLNDGVHIDLAAGTESGAGYGSDKLSGIEDVETSNNAVVTGDANANRIDAGTGSTIHGGGGNDTLNATGSVHGDAGNDVIYDPHVSNQTYDGGTGFDVLDGRYGIQSALTVNLGSGTVASASESNVHLVSIEGAIGTSGADLLIGSPSGNFFQGLAGNDTIQGLAGNDILLGGDGNDTIDGGAGTDTCQQNAGSGTLTNCP